MHDVEAYMGEIGRRCNTRILDKKESNLRTWTEEVVAPSTNISENHTDLGDDAHDLCGRQYTLRLRIPIGRPPPQSRCYFEAFEKQEFRTAGRQSSGDLKAAAHEALSAAKPPTILEQFEEPPGKPTSQTVGQD